MILFGFAVSSLRRPNIHLLNHGQIISCQRGITGAGGCKQSEERLQVKADANLWFERWKKIDNHSLKSCVQFILFHIQILYSKYHAALFVKCFTYIDLGNYIPKIYLDLYLYDNNSTLYGGSAHLHGWIVRQPGQPFQHHTRIDKDIEWRFACMMIYLVIRKNCWYTHEVKHKI